MERKATLTSPAAPARFAIPRQVIGARRPGILRRFSFGAHYNALVDVRREVRAACTDIFRRNVFCFLRRRNLSVFFFQKKRLKSSFRKATSVLGRFFQFSSRKGVFRAWRPGAPNCRSRLYRGKHGFHTGRGAPATARHICRRARPAFRCSSMG